MRNGLFYILLMLILMQSSCKKGEIPPTSGTATIDNTTTLGQTYYVYGFLFSEAKKVSTLGDPVDVITISAEVDINNVITRITFNANTYKESFFLFGEYSDATAASLAFKNLIQDMFDDFVIEKTEAEIREVAPTLDLNQRPDLLMLSLETNYPELFDNFAEWIFNKQKIA